MSVIVGKDTLLLTDSTLNHSQHAVTADLLNYSDFFWRGGGYKIIGMLLIPITVHVHVNTPWLRRIGGKKH